MSLDFTGTSVDLSIVDELMECLIENDSGWSLVASALLLLESQGFSGESLYSQCIELCNYIFQSTGYTWYNIDAIEQVPQKAENCFTVNVTFSRKLTIPYSKMVDEFIKKEDND